MAEKSPPHLKAIDREIEVELGDDEPKVPKAFRLDATRYSVAGLLRTWPDAALASTPRTANRRSRPSRTFFRVKTEEGTIFDIYCDWFSNKKQRWVLHRKLA